MKKNGILLSAKTTKWAENSRGKDLYLNYEFYYNGEKITGFDAFQGIDEGDPFFENHYFPVIYNPKGFGHSELLITPKDFRKYNIPFPDSLKWVLQHVHVTGR